MIPKERNWYDPPSDTGIEKRWGIIGAIVYPTLCLVALGIAHFIFNQPIFIEPVTIVMLVLSPILGAIFFWVGASVLSNMLGNVT